MGTADHKTRTGRSTMGLKLLYFSLFVALSAAQIVPYTEFFFEQRIDHFNYYSKPMGKSTFQQRYLVQDKWWDKDNGGPLFFYTGNEGDITSFWDNTGFMFDIAPKFKANIIFAEHRYYGKSLPLGNDSFTHPNVDFLTIEQALADYAVLIDHLKLTFNANNSAVIAFGGSYGGMLAAYFRFKYPNIVDGSIAASAPIFLVAGESDRSYFFEDITSHFTNAAAGCGERVRTAFAKMQTLANTGPSGLSSLSQTFNLCNVMKNDTDYSQLIGWVRNSFAQLAMMDYPYATSFIAPLPGWPVKKSCSLLLGESDPIKGLYLAAKLVYS